MSSKDKDIQLVKQLLDAAESNIRQVRSLLFAAEIIKQAQKLADNSDDQIVEGIFDGEGMVAPDGERYPVSPNYASKSKLVPGDVLKLTILADGSFLFKQIGPIKRKKIIGQLVETERGRYVVEANDRVYQVLLASVTYFKAEPGDKMTIIVPETGESEWAAVENVLEKGTKL